jgi:hypothetical protein
MQSCERAYCPNSSCKINSSTIDLFEKIQANYDATSKEIKLNGIEQKIIFLHIFNSIGQILIIKPIVNLK